MKTMASVTSAIWTLMTVLGFASPASALLISGVSAPNLKRPIDGVTYPFQITLSGTYGAGDVLGVNVHVDYWDDDGVDDEIDLVTGSLRLPGGGNGVAWGPSPVTLKVGCRDDPELEVFGPSGGTGESPMTDGFFIPSTGVGAAKVTYGDWGKNTVTCEGSTPTGADLLPLKRIDVVPGPATLVMVAIALLGLGSFRGWRRGLP